MICLNLQMGKRNRYFNRGMHELGTVFKMLSAIEPRKYKIINRLYVNIQ